MHINIGKVSAIAIVLITLVLFIAAVFTKGLTHDIFLEAGVFLVSVKVIFLTFKTHTITKSIQKQLEDIHSLLSNKKAHKSPKASDEETWNALRTM